MSDYPAPRYPKIKKSEVIDKLLIKVKELLTQPPGRHAMSFKPSYGLKRGDKVLFVVLSEYDPMIINAMCKAMREMGVSVDLLTLDSTPVAPPEELAVHEAIAFDKDEGEYNYYYTKICDLLRTSTGKALVELEKYNLVIAGMAGAIPNVPFPWRRFNYTSLYDFAPQLIDFPPDLMELIDNKLFNLVIKSCKKLHLTDPEGTDVRWTNYDDKRTLNPGHILARPYNIGYGFGGKDDCAGVIAGTLNHLGAFPYCKAYIEGGQVVKVESGGKYGDVWRQMLKKYKDVKMPPLPLEVGTGIVKVADIDDPKIEKYQVSDPGLFWYFEAAIGTLPGVFRLPEEGLFKCYANMLHDRKRAGYIHNGFGPPARGRLAMVKAGLPWTHVHIHSVFATLEGVTQEGKTVAVIDKGHLTVLDDPEVRALASKYGDPDKLLTEAWIPAMPGINVPGDYMKDYAQNPIPWIQKEAKEHPIWVD